MKRVPLLGLLLLVAAASTRGASSQVWSLDWDQLLPEKEQAAYEPGPPDPVHGYLGEGAPAAHQVMHFETNPKLDNRIIRIAGFIAPINLDSKGKIIDFYLVPYFGACIHVPPPPPNQLIYVKLKTPAAVESTYDAYWVTGKVRIDKVTTVFGATAYSMQGDEIQEYEYPKK